MQLPFATADDVFKARSIISFPPTVLVQKTVNIFVGSATEKAAA